MITSLAMTDLAAFTAPPAARSRALPICAPPLLRGGGAFAGADSDARAVTRSSWRCRATCLGGTCDPEGGHLQGDGERLPGNVIQEWGFG